MRYAHKDIQRRAWMLLPAGHVLKISVGNICPHHVYVT